MATKEIERNSGKAWLAAIVITLACATSALVSSKFSPAMTQLMEAFNISLTQASFITSVTSIGGMILALPGGALATRIGAKNMTLAGLACLTIGALTGVFTSSYVVLLVGRVIEGLGNALMMVLGPSVIALLFTKEKIGLPMGIQGIWNPLGGFVVLIIGAPILASFGWQGLWWVGIVLSVIMFALVFLFVPDDRAIRDSNIEQASDQSTRSKIAISAVLKNPTVWIIAFLMSGYTVVSIGVQGFAPVYLQQAAGYGADQANLVSSMLPFGKMIGSIVAGAIMLKVAKKQHLLIAVLACVTILSFTLFSFTGDTSMLLIVAVFLVTGFIMLFTPPTVNSLTPELLTDPRAIATAMGIIILMQNVASFFGPILITTSVDASGGNWATAGIVVGVSVFVALVMAVILALMLKKKSQEPTAAANANAEQVR